MTKYLYLLVATISSVFIFQNCQPTTALHVVNNLSKSKKALAVEPQSFVSPFTNSKVQIQLDRLGAQAASGSMLPKGFELSVLINNNCVQSFAASSSSNKVSSSLKAQQGSTIYNMSEQNYNIKLDQETSLADITEQFEQDPCVMGVTEEKYLQANLNDDPQFNNQAYLRLINSPGSHFLFWQSDVKITMPVVIAILDTGIDQDHPDLVNMLWKNGNNETGFDFVNNDSNPDDDQGHGTHVSGLSAMQSDNQTGGSGVMGFQAQLMGVKVLDGNGSGSITNIANGIRYAADNKADVINMSLGGQGASQQLLTAMQYALERNVTVLVAAGNDNQEVSANNPYSPAMYGFNNGGIITVGSISENNAARSGFSNFSTSYVEIGAPGSGNGGGVLSTVVGGGYDRLQGTSMATPVTAGAAALAIGMLKSNGITYTPTMIEDILTESALKDANLANVFKEGNRLDLLRMATYIKNSHLITSDAGVGEDQ